MGINSLYRLTCNTASKWLLRQNAIKNITAYVAAREVEAKSTDAVKNSSFLLLLVKEHTRGFKESIVNIMKAVLQFFMAMIEYHESREKEFADWAMQDGIALAVQKISDRKLSAQCKDLLTEMCVGCVPSTVLAEVSSSLGSVRSSFAHEETLRCFRAFAWTSGQPPFGKD